jgi:hypothetical protein
MTLKAVRLIENMYWAYRVGLFVGIPYEENQTRSVCV